MSHQARQGHHRASTEARPDIATLNQRWGHLPMIGCAIALCIAIIVVCAVVQWAT
jgi:hypothetical protein